MNEMTGARLIKKKNSNIAHISTDKKTQYERLRIIICIFLVLPCEIVQ